MSERRSIEVTADTVDEAISQGLKQLNASPGDVIVEVLDEPSRGVFGIGARPAKVRLQLLRVAPPPPPPAPPPAPVPDSAPAQAEAETADEDDSPTPTEISQREPRGERGDRSGRSRGGRGRRDDRRRDESRDTTTTARVRGADDYEFSEEDDLLAFVGGEVIGLEGEAAEAAQIARTVLVELLQKMGMRGFDVDVTQAEGSEPDETPPLLLNINGPEIDHLIGRRGETLSSLQYVTRLIASRRLQRRANIVIDAGGYKLRRSQKLRELAIRMAEQAVEQARIIYMEPMPPHERRMIHMALRNHPLVVTKSTGEGDARKVTIVPK